MTLDITNANPHYLLGRMWAICEAGAEKSVPSEIVMQMAARPLTGLALLQRWYTSQPLLRVRRARYDTMIGEVLDHVSADDFPTGPTAIADQGPLHVGYFQQKLALESAA